MLEPGVFYVSMEYATVLHACCCGCGNKVVTPLSPKRWCLTYDGKTLSLDPSIGNWSFPCESHYWIERNVVIWDRGFTRTEIAAARAADRRDMESGARGAIQDRKALTSGVQIAEDGHVTVSWWRRFLGRSSD